MRGETNISENGRIIATMDICGKLIPFRLCRASERSFDLEFSAQLPNGTTMCGSDINDLRSDVRDMLTGLDKAKWHKMIMIEVDLDNYVRGNATSVELDWQVIQEAKLSKGKIVHRNEEGHSVTVRVKHTLIPWTQQRENVLSELTKQVRDLGERLEDFMRDKNLKKKLDTVTLKQLVENT